MDTDVNQLKRSLARAIVWILLLLVVATGSTYAWFSLTGINSTNVTPMAGTVSKGNSSLLISNNELAHGCYHYIFSWIFGKISSRNVILSPSRKAFFVSFVYRTLSISSLRILFLVGISRSQ